MKFDYTELFNKIENMKDDEQAQKMAAYMQNQFLFLGIPKPALKNAIKLYLKQSKQYGLDWEFIRICWDKPYREAQYIALEHLALFSKKLTEEDLPELKNLIITKSWWETVDTIDAFVGTIVINNPEFEETMLEWSKSDNIWLRRVAIDFQQEFKDKTNTQLLEQIIVNNLGSNEFFINKAIGWSLRDYSKENADWVRSFIEKYQDKLSKLSIKEASKYI